MVYKAAPKMAVRCCLVVLVLVGRRVEFRYTAAAEMVDLVRAAFA